MFYTGEIFLFLLFLLRSHIDDNTPTYTSFPLGLLHPFLKEFRKLSAYFYLCLFLWHNISLIDISRRDSLAQLIVDSIWQPLLRSADMRATHFHEPHPFYTGPLHSPVEMNFYKILWHSQDFLRPLFPIHSIRLIYILHQNFYF